MQRSAAKPTILTMLCSLFLMIATVGTGAPYDPLAVAAETKPLSLDLTVSDTERERELPIRVFLPPGEEAAPVILFSHGLGGSRAGSNFLGEHWAARGYVVVFLQHPGSDSSVWKDVPRTKRLLAMRQAASGQNFMLRVRDVSAVLDQLTAWNKAEDHQLAGRLDLTKVGMSGHSFGAITTQAVSGQTLPGGKAAFTDQRIKAAVPMSPSSPRHGTPASAFGSVSIPWLLMTGTHDLARIGKADMASRLAVFPALPPGGKYELVLSGAEHSAFTERALPGDKKPRNPNHHRVILALSTAFWDTYLRDDSKASEWLHGDGPTSVLEEGDTWQAK